MKKKFNFFFLLIIVFQFSCSLNKPKSEIVYNTNQRLFRDEVLHYENSKKKIVIDFDDVQKTLNKHIENLTKKNAPQTKLSIRECLNLAFERNYEYQTNVENIYLAALSLIREKNSWSPQFSNITGIDFNQYSENKGKISASNTFRINKKFFNGSSVDFSLSASLLERIYGTVTNSRSAGVSFNYSIPLLKDSGKKIAMESLNQAERNFLYSVREFDNSRQSFAIRMISTIYSILETKERLTIAASEVKRYSYLLERTDALFSTNRAPAIDLQRAEQELFSSKNRYYNAIKQYDEQLDDFKFQLNISIEGDIVLEDNLFIDTGAELNYSELFETALSNRLDLQNDMDRLDDVKRQLDFKKNKLRPSLNMNINGSAYNDDPKKMSAIKPEKGSYSLKFDFNLPINQLNENADILQSEYSLLRAERNIIQKKELIKKEIRLQLNKIRNTKESIAIQKSNIELANKRVENAYFLLQEGKNSNRDVIEAEEALAAAMISLNNADYDLKRAILELRQDIGRLDVDKLLSDARSAEY